MLIINPTGSNNVYWTPLLSTDNVGDIIGGTNTTMTNTNFTTVAGGQNNSVSGGTHVFIGGGFSNTAASTGAFVGGGFNNIVTGTGSQFSSIVGGQSNNINGSRTGYHFIGGGANNSITGAAGDFNVIVGGGGTTLANRNLISAGANNFIGGGLINTISATGTTRGNVIVGGASNTISASVGATGTNFIGGGLSNSITANAGDGNVIVGGGQYTTTLAGPNTIINGSYGFIGGGQLNSITALGTTHWGAVVCGGNSNAVSGGDVSSGNSTPGGIVSGFGNKVQQKGGFVGAGYNNTVNGVNSAVVCGDSNNVSANNSIICCGSLNNAPTKNLINSGASYSFVGAGIGNQITSGGTLRGNGGGFSSIVGGDNNIINGGTTAPGMFIGGGFSNTAVSTGSSIVGGTLNYVSGIYTSIGGGASNTASVAYSCIPGGLGLNANIASSTAAACIVGTYNRIAASSTGSALFMVGNGATEPTRNNAFSVLNTGNCYAQGTFFGGGADYAEYFEAGPADIPYLTTGTTVEIDSDTGYIRPALAGGVPDGVVRPKGFGISTVIGNACEDDWQGKYLRSDDGSYIMELVPLEIPNMPDPTPPEDPAPDPVPTTRDIPAPSGLTTLRPRLNPNYDPSKPYTPRSQRPEWFLIGLMGRVLIRPGQPIAPTWKRIKIYNDTYEEWLVK